MIRLPEVRVGSPERRQPVQPALVEEGVDRPEWWRRSPRCGPLTSTAVVMSTESRAGPLQRLGGFESRIPVHVGDGHPRRLRPPGVRRCLAHARPAPVTTKTSPEGHQPGQRFAAGLRRSSVARIRLVVGGPVLTPVVSGPTALMIAPRLSASSRSTAAAVSGLDGVGPGGRREGRGGDIPAVRGWGRRPRRALGRPRAGSPILFRPLEHRSPVGPVGPGADPAHLDAVHSGLPSPMRARSETRPTHVGAGGDIEMTDTCVDQC